MTGSVAPAPLIVISTAAELAALTPQDGEEITYIADATNGVLWRFRYRGASGSSFKWEFVSGSPLFAEITAGDSITATSYAAAPTNPGPTVTVPLAGDYMVDLGAYGRTDTVTAGARYSYAIGATAAVDADSVRFDTDVANQGVVSSKMRRKTGLAAATALAGRYQTGAGTALFLERWMAVTPVRVG